MAEMAHESLSMWNELEQDAGEALRLMTGLLNFGDPEYGAGGPEGKCSDNTNITIRHMHLCRHIDGANRESAGPWYDIQDS
jgi:sarcosine oxidase/L-pipecolate oxidase